MLPIAGLDYFGHNCRGMDGFDLLCLYFAEGGEVSVVTWPFASSWYDRPPAIVRLADSFADFLPKLFRDDNPITREVIDTF